MMEPRIDTKAINQYCPSTQRSVPGCFFAHDPTPVFNAVLLLNAMVRKSYRLSTTLNSVHFSYETEMIFSLRRKSGSSLGCVMSPVRLKTAVSFTLIIPAYQQAEDDLIRQIFSLWRLCVECLQLSRDID